MTGTRTPSTHPENTDQPASRPATPGPTAGLRWSRWWFLGGTLAAAAVVVAVSLLAGARPYLLLGLNDPGTLVAIGAPMLRLFAEIAATVCLGALAFGVCCTRPQSSGVVSPEAFGELRVASRAAVVWAGCAVLLVPFSAADIVGQPLSRVLDPDNLLGLLGIIEPPRAWLLTAAIAVVLAVSCRMALRWQPMVVLCGLAVLGVIPPIVTGHGSSGTGHDLATAALVLHVPIAAAWIGVLLALLRQARRGGRALPELVRAYSRLASWGWLALAASGIVLGLVLAGDHLIGSPYGTLLLAKTVLAVLLGAGGHVLRNRALRGLDTRPAAWRSVARIGLVELVMLLGLLGVSVGLTHLALPGFLAEEPSTTEMMLGYQLNGPPTVLALLTEWRPELVFAPLAILLAGAYLFGRRRLVAAGQHWPAARTAAWLAGCAVLLLATSSGIGRYGAAMFSIHQLGHMMISMLAPALLVLGAPLSLVRAARSSGERRVPGAGELIERLRDSRAVRLLTHPLIALALFAGSPFLLYFTELFDALVRYHWGHLLITTWFLVVGYLFFWPLIGPDRAPRPLPNLARLGVLLAAMPADILFGALVISTDRIIGNGFASANFYEALSLAWVDSLHADQRLGGIIALVVGELTLFIALAALLARWNRVDTEDEESGLGAYRTLVRDARGG